MQNDLLPRNKRIWAFMIGFVLCGGLILSTNAALAVPPPPNPGGLGEMALKVTQAMKGFSKLIIASAYVAGMGFAIGAVMKFKAHKDNPTQIPVGTPIALLFIAAALIFLPGIFSTVGNTLFGSTEGIKGSIDGTGNSYTSAR